MKMKTAKDEQGNFIDMLPKKASDKERFNEKVIEQDGKKYMIYYSKSGNKYGFLLKGKNK